MSLQKKTKLIATIGPATDDLEMVTEMIREGVNVFRLNFSHGTYESHARLAGLIREAAEKLDVNVAILQDLQGPKIRVGLIPDDNMNLKKGSKVTLTAVEPENGEIPLQYKDLVKDANPGDLILLDDANLELKVLSKTDDKILARVIVGGILKSNKGINLPTSTISAQSITQKDRKDLEFGLKLNVDFVALSFVKSAEDIEELRALIKKHGGTAKIVAKLERHEAVKNMEEIVAATDVVMVARGDLGVELKTEKVPVIQKKMIKECLRQNKPVIVATQMLESMIKNPRPTRAEATDVANAILDGADAVMLSAETATGEYPLEAIRTITEIAKDVEDWVTRNEIVIGRSTLREPEQVIDAIANTVVRLAKNTGAKLIMTATSTGKTSTVISNRRPFVPVLATTHNDKAKRYMAILWGVDAYKVDFDTVAEMLDSGMELAKSTNYVKSGDRIIVASGKFPGVPGGTNIVEVKTVE
ncbi:TPA: pyruvate kinase [candidate division CPR2 bacterium]|uniref:Pyruvate kinase n=1 Tax=candidate division CPR2 bacterium GW2011_GWC1_41_48 TaxID=1618344 RepID=A0A0G0Z8K7_UNCC2|nr:MAG: Pyruvate kinase [candidate division CPR2 bacterium GW2011_GWC2_39_35]KKS09383.1 MAG: Pyruvate kinase [candidate division CPR2 bacterium GW2011_GWC1_41_48]HBG82139.1 pyruvate kinase [candidate division CPR2 bacterium]